MRRDFPIGHGVAILAPDVGRDFGDAPMVDGSVTACFATTGSTAFAAVSDGDSDGQRVFEANRVHGTKGSLLRWFGNLEPGGGDSIDHQDGKLLCVGEELMGEFCGEFFERCLTVVLGSRVVADADADAEFFAAIVDVLGLVYGDTKGVLEAELPAGLFRDTQRTREVKAHFMRGNAFGRNHERCSCRNITGR